MSFILKALRKLEDEKAARKNGPVAIDSAILASDTNSPVLPRRSGKMMIAALVVMAGAIAGYIALRSSDAPVMRVRERVAQPAAVAPVAPIARPVPASPLPQPAVAPLPVAETAVPPARPLAVSTLATASEQVNKRRHRTREASSGAARLASQEPPARGHEDALAAPPAAAGLTVSGIALQDDPSASMAVVNGALVKTGMSVGGVEVERIFVDRVRFKGTSGTFEVP